MPGAYKPPLFRRAQAVRTRRRASLQRWRWWWVVPALGLLPVLVAAVLASEGRLGMPAGVPAASAPLTQAARTAAVQATPGQPAEPTQAAAEPAAPGVAAQVVSTPTPAPAVAAAPTAQAVSPASASSQPSVLNAPAASPPRPSTSGPFQAYRVQPGDTVRVIAQAYGVSTMSIAQASGLRNADQLRVGQVLTIPNQPGSLYRIQPGETLNQIAARTGVPVEIIASASLLSSEAVQAGDVILIPEQARGK